MIAVSLRDAVKVQGRGRLVEQQHLRVGDQRLDDFQELALGGRQFADQARSGEMPRS